MRFSLRNGVRREYPVAMVADSRGGATGAQNQKNLIVYYFCLNPRYLLHKNEAQRSTREHPTKTRDASRALDAGPGPSAIRGLQASRLWCACANINLLRPPPPLPPKCSNHGSAPWQPVPHGGYRCLRRLKLLTSWLHLLESRHVHPVTAT